MNRESQVRFVAVLLFLLTVAAVLFAGFNFNAEIKSSVPDDGIWWIENKGRLMADRLKPDGPGALSGIKPGDQLVSINGQEIHDIYDLERQMYQNGIWSKATYSVIRHSVPLDSTVILSPAPRSLSIWLRLIALIYLGIGLYVLLRRWTAPGSTHFYIFCLVSFVAYSFKYTGKLNDFDWTIYWGNIVAGVLPPCSCTSFLSFPKSGCSSASIPRSSRWSMFLRRFCWPFTSAPCAGCKPACGYDGTSTAWRWPTDRCCFWLPPACFGTATAAPAPRFFASN
jgi:hypothetical protein